MSLWTAESGTWDDGPLSFVVVVVVVVVGPSVAQAPNAKRQAQARQLPMNFFMTRLLHFNAAGAT